ncbi:Uncharacterised protein [Staphylococcus aureus]|nr:Uncharacterised protein [Staphylococcus aureus]
MFAFINAILTKRSVEVNPPGNPNVPASLPKGSIVTPSNNFAVAG